MLDSVRGSVAPDKLSLWFSQSIRERHEYDNTHPSLGERLAAIGYPELDYDSDLLNDDLNLPSAVDHFLPAVPDEFIASKNRLWRESAAQGWRNRHQFVQEAEKKLEVLNKKAEAAALDPPGKVGTSQFCWRTSRPGNGYPLSA
jgi:hypothetical protein